MTETVKKGKTRDLSKGPILSSMMLFALPLLAGQFFQTLYNSVDSIIIGNFASSDPAVSARALAAVTASGTLSMIISGFFNGMGAGASALFARLFGAKEHKTLHDAIHTTVLFSIILGVVLAGAGVIFTPQILKLVACPDTVYDMALVYLRIYLIGVLFTSIYNIAAGVLRSVGDSRSPFIFLVISSVLNIILDMIFVAWLGWGVAGVAVATIISQALSMVLAFREIMRLDESYRFHISHMRIDWGLLGQVVRLGIPAGLQTSLIAISNVLVQRYINGFSDVAVAGVGSAMKIDQFAGMPCMALGLAMTTFIGQNIGAKQNGRAHRSIGIAVLSSIVFIIILSIPVYIFAPNLVGLFNSEPSVIHYGTGMLHTLMPLYIFMGVNQIFGGVLRGFGYSITSMVCGIVGMVGVRQLWLFIFLNYVGHSINYVYWCYPVTWICALMPMVVIYFVRIRKKFPAKAAF